MCLVAQILGIILMRMAVGTLKRPNRVLDTYYIELSPAKNAIMASQDALRH